MKPFLSAVLLGVILASINLLLTFWGLLSNHLLVWTFPFIMIFSFLLAATHHWSMNPKNPNAFVRIFMGSIIIKLFSALIFLTVTLFLNKSWEIIEKIELSAIVFITYLTFTIYMGKAQASKDAGAEKNER